MSYSERIKQLVEFEGSQAKFCRKAGLNRQAVNRIINQGSGVNGDTIVAIAQAYPNLSMEWFVNGEGEMWKSDQLAGPDTEKEVLKELVESQKSQIRMLTQAILEKAPELGKWLRLEEE